MTLRAIHDFEVALLDCCLAMTERGMRVDNARRLSMIDRIDSMRAPMTEALSEYVVKRVIPENRERLGAKAHLFTKRTVCRCCRNGKGKREACWACAGFEKKPTKKQLRQRADDSVMLMRGERTQVGDVIVIDVTPLKPCAVCAGAGESFATTFNPASPEQTKVVLYDLLRLPKRTKDGKLCTDEESLKSLLADAPDEARTCITQLLRLGKLDTMRSILVRIAPGEDGKIRAVWNPAGTETGRPSISETFLVVSTNLGNLPKREAVDADFDVRSCIVADEDCVLVEADLSSAEAWVTAALSEDHALLKVLRSGAKLHRWRAARALGKPEADVTEQEYSLYKTAGHALNYGMQWGTFMKNVNAVADRTGLAINAAQAKATYANYHAMHPLSAWWDKVLGKLVTTGKITTCFGRTRTFYGRNRGERLGEAHREAIAHEPQSTIADLLNRGMLRWWRQHDGRVGELLAQVYDSMIVQTSVARGNMVAELVRRCLSEDIVVNGITIRIPVDVKVMRTWAVHREGT